MPTPSRWSEFERRVSRYRDEEKHQTPDNSVLGRFEAPRNVDLEHAHLVPETDWGTGMNWDAE